MYNLFWNSLYSFHLVDGKHPILFFDWTVKTSGMNYENFQAACNNFAGFAWEYKSKHLLIDTCRFEFQLPIEFTVWREEKLNPRYYKLGVQKFVCITTHQLLTYTKDIRSENGKFETLNFTTFQEAINWLNE